MSKMRIGLVIALIVLCAGLVQGCGCGFEVRDNYRGGTYQVEGQNEGLAVEIPEGEGDVDIYVRRPPPSGRAKVAILILAGVGIFCAVCFGMGQNH